MVFIDLNKVFDTVDNDIFAKKLYCYGVRDKEFKWFKSYLNDKQQSCKVNGISLNLQYTKCRVPQGSCIGPLLFLLFINEKPLSLHHSKVTMYADDITKSMTAELENVIKWLHGNKLTLNVAKTTSMIIATNRKLSKQQWGAYAGTFQNFWRSN